MIRMGGKQQIIIFDGPDGCGKTNIARALAGALGIVYFKNADEHKYFRSDPNYFINAVRYVDTYFTSYLEVSRASVILDRAWPSEWIYSQALGRSTDMGMLLSLDARHATLNTIIISPFRSSYEGINDEYPEINQRLDRIDDLYCQFAEWSKCHILRINVDSEDLQQQLQIILDFIRSVSNSPDKLYYTR